MPTCHTALPRVLTSEDRTQFTEFERKYRKAIYGYCYRLTGNRDDAEDLYQDALVNAWVGFAGFRQSEPFINWATKIVTNMRTDQLRASSRKVKTTVLHAASDEADDELEIEIADQEFDPAQIVESTVLSDQLHAALDGLPKIFRNVFELLMDDNSYNDISEIMHCPKTTVRTRAFRGRKLLRKALANEEFYAKR